MKRSFVAIQRNPTSGSGRGREQLLELVRELKKSGFRPRLFSNREKMDQWVNEPANSEKLNCIVAAGGDGTIGSVVNRFPGHTLATLPLGTENLLAKYLKVECSGRQVARIISDGKIRTFDTGIVEHIGEPDGGTHCFTLMASVGFDAEVVRRTDAARTGPIRKWNYLQPILASLRSYKHPELQVFVDGAAEPLVGALVIVVNIPGYAFGLKPAKSADGSDGQLDVRIFQKGSAFQMMRYCLKVATASHEELEDVICVQGKSIVIQSQPNSPAQVDGDPAGFSPIQLGIDPGSLKMLVPADSNS